MLQEIKKVKQNDGEKLRRWFTDDNWDLYVWFEEDKTIYGFQLCYAKDKMEHALTWIRDQGEYHSEVESRQPFSGGGNLRAPILVADGSFNNRLVAQLFDEASTGIDPQIRAFVLAKIRGFENRG